MVAFFCARMALSVVRSNSLGSCMVVASVVPTLLSSMKVQPWKDGKPGENILIGLQIEK
jgi:hypothetical protein